MFLFGLDNLGQDFQVVIVTLVGDLQSDNLGVPFSSPGQLLVDQAGELAGLNADAVEVLVKEAHSSLSIMGDPPVGIV